MRRAAWLVLAVALVSAWVVVARVRLSPDISELLPDRGDAAALARYLHAFGGGDPGLVLVEADDPKVAEEAARALVREAARAPSVVDAYEQLTPEGELLPSQAMLLADRAAWTEIARALTPAGMAARLAETRALALAPGSGALAAAIARDPLRIAELSLASQAEASGRFVSADGRARLVVIAARGSSLKSADARAFVGDVRAAIATVGSRFPAVAMGLAGGHAIAEATERGLRRDLTLSSVLATALASAIFVLLLRRPRALLAIVPPLVLGTIITAAVAALFPRGLSALAVAFASVVVGVGMDTGVHVYAATREACARGASDPAAEARAKTARPVLGAAAVAGAAFACLALSRIEALRQLGILAAVGEVATAIALLVLTPEVAARLERSTARAGNEAPRPRWAVAVPRLARRSLALAVLAFGAAAAIALATGVGRPETRDGVVTLRPRPTGADDPHAVYARIAARLGQVDEAPLVVLIDDPGVQAARGRGDAVFAALAARRDVVRELRGATPLAPSEAVAAARLRARDELDLPARAETLARALTAAGFVPARFAAALDDLRHPAAPFPLARATRAVEARFFAHDEAALVTIHVVPTPGRDAEVEAVVHAIDPAARVTGLGLLDRALRASLLHDLPRVAALALALALVALALTLRRAGDVALAAGIVLAEIALVLVAMRVLGVPLHVYDALVLPVLLGVTLDEVLFVLMAVRAGGGDDAARAAVVHEAPLVATTALTTAAGFGALLICDFAPLRHLGATGAIGSIVGLVLALVVVPGLTLARAKPASS